MSLKEMLGFLPNFKYSSLGYSRQKVIYNGVECVWGLSEKGRPPTLIYPRPRIYVKRREVIGGVECNVIYDNNRDDSMSICIEKEEPEVIAKAMFDDNLYFEYDLT